MENLFITANSELNTIYSAMNMFKRYTCVRFVRRTENDELFVSIVNNNTGCYSYIGRQSDNQYNLINLQTPECLMAVGTPVHEMMHALGFYHEFVRPDRDDYISINRSALRPDLQGLTECSILMYSTYIRCFQLIIYMTTTLENYGLKMAKPITFRITMAV